MKLFLHCAPAVFLSTFAVSAETVPAAIVTSEFVYERASYPECHASTIVEAADGTLVAAWFGGTKEKNPDVGIWVSRREGGRWIPSVEVANGVLADGTRHPTWNPVLFQPRNGPLLLFYKVGPSPESWWGMRRTSVDGGKTWSEGRRLPDGIIGPVKNKPVELSDGTLLSSASIESPERPSKWQVHFERSTDWGQTWTATPPVNEGVAIAAIQPSILFHGGHRLQARGRTSQSRVFTIWSEDEGRTWGPMTLLDLPNPNAGTDAVTLTDGRQLLIYNHSEKGKGRTPLNVGLSVDGGRWRSVVVLESDQGKNGYSYPAVIQSRDGMVHVTYTWRRERIKHVVLDPRKL